MSKFDDEYNKICFQQNIIQEWTFKDGLNSVKKAWNAGVNWTMQKINAAAQALWNALSLENLKESAKYALNLVGKLSTTFQQQFNGIKSALQDEKFQQYCAKQISNNYNQQQIKNLTFAQKKQLTKKYAESYLKSEKSNLINQSQLICQQAITLTVCIILVLLTATGCIIGLGEWWKRNRDKIFPKDPKDMDPSQLGVFRAKKQAEAAAIPQQTEKQKKQYEKQLNDQEHNELMQMLSHE